MSARTLLIAIAFATAIASTNSLAGEPATRSTELEARVQYSRKARIEKLVWDDLSVPVEIEFGEFQYRPFVTLRGTFERPEWALAFGEKTLVSSQDLLDPDETGRQVSDPGEFELKVRIRSRITPLLFTAVGPYGKTERARTYIVIKDWHSLEDEIASRKVPKEHQLSASLGPSMLSYTQTGKSDFSSVLLSAKIGYFHRLSLRWDLGLNAYMNVSQLSSNQPDVVVRFVCANLRAGYRLPQVRDPWSLSILTGAYYFTMLVTDRQFGFRNVMGPQLYPLLLRKFENGSSGYAYLKYSPVSQGPFEIRSLSSRELGVGAGYALKPGSNRQRLGFSIDYADLRLEYDGGSATARTITVSASYGLVIR